MVFDDIFFFIYFQGAMWLDDMADENISVMCPGTNEVLLRLQG